MASAHRVDIKPKVEAAYNNLSDGTKTLVRTVNLSALRELEEELQNYSLSLANPYVVTLLGEVSQEMPKALVDVTSVEKKLKQIKERIKENLYQLEETLPEGLEIEISSQDSPLPYPIKISKKPHLSVEGFIQKQDTRRGDYEGTPDTTPCLNIKITEKFLRKGTKLCALGNKHIVRGFHAYSWRSFDLVFGKLQINYQKAIENGQTVRLNQFNNIFAFYFNLPDLVYREVDEITKRELEREKRQIEETTTATEELSNLLST